MITRPHPVSDFLGTLFDFLKIPGIELFVPRVYSDSRGIPTLGVGYALVVEGAEGWTRRTTLVADLAAIGITLSPEQIQMLDDAAGVLNGQGGTNPIPRWPGGENVMGFVITVGNARTLFDRIIGEYQQRVQAMLGTEAYNQLGNSSEMVALVSLAYNNVIKAGGTGTPKLREAILNDNRAEAWYQIRYQSNANKLSGLATRRFRESDLFGLYDSGNLTDEQEIAQAKEAMRMYTRYRDSIITYENKYIDSIGNAESNTIDQEIGRAWDGLIAYFAGGRTIDGEVIVGHGVLGYGVEKYSSVDSISTLRSNAGNFTTDKNDLVFGEAGADTIHGGSGNDVIYGGADADILYGDAGNDFLYGGEGDDTHYINTGDGTDTIEDKQGKDKVFINGKLVPDLFLVSVSDGSYRSADGAFIGLKHSWDPDMLIIEVATGTSVILNENFADGDFGIHLRDAPTDPAPTATIYGDRQSIYDPPQYDSLGNEITDLYVVQSGKNDRLYDSAGTTGSRAAEGTTKSGRNEGGTIFSWAATARTP